MSKFADNEYLFTSESVTEGHPDKVADQISDGVLDAVLAGDSNPKQARVSCEVLVNTGLAVVSGEIRTDAVIDVQKIARATIEKIGYTDGREGFAHNSASVLDAMDPQSADIAQGVDDAAEHREGHSTDAIDLEGAGDQGMMFGYASNETPEYMPLAIQTAHRLAQKLADVRKSGELDYLRPDAKTQVSVRYRDGKPVGIEKLLISTQHTESIHDDQKRVKSDLWETVVKPVLPVGLYDENALYEEFLVNPTGRFVIGGPVGDTGLTGRKIIVDTYGGFARHGGGAFSGKDSSKVDRSAAYAVRWVAKNGVAAGLGPAEPCMRFQDRPDQRCGCMACGLRRKSGLGSRPQSYRTGKARANSAHPAGVVSLAGN